MRLPVCAAIASLLTLGAAPASAMPAAKTTAIAKKPASKGPIIKGPWQVVETSGWRAEIPKEWKAGRKLKVNAKKPYAGLWTYVSPNKSFRLRVRISEMRGRLFAAIAKKSFGRVVRRLPTLKLLRSKVVPLAGRKLWYFLGSARVLRKKRNHEYLVYRLHLEAPKRKLFVSVEVEGADEKLARLEAIAAHLTDTFALVEPSSVKLPAPAKGKPTTAPKTKGGAR
jgi:hypothetical protein